MDARVVTNLGLPSTFVRARVFVKNQRVGRLHARDAAAASSQQMLHHRLRTMCRKRRYYPLSRRRERPKSVSDTAELAAAASMRPQRASALAFFAKKSDCRERVVGRRSNVGPSRLVSASAAASCYAQLCVRMLQPRHGANAASAGRRLEAAAAAHTACSPRGRREAGDATVAPRAG